MQVDVSIVDGRNFCSHGNNSAKVQRERNANNNTPSFHWASQSRISNLKPNRCILLICPNPSTVLITFFSGHVFELFCLDSVLFICILNGIKEANASSNISIIIVLAAIAAFGFVFGCGCLFC